ncbi:polysaccharide biosynthesis tyrosine autokinase, partial [bacterium]|nr:polysaccharide biosynthesis tyrosine autokinase [bacterium]
IQSDIHRQVNLISGLKQDRNTLQIAETARVPRTPRDKNIMETAIIATVIGLIVAAGGVIIFEFFKSTVETSMDINTLLNLPVLGVISRFGSRIRYIPILGWVIRLVTPQKSYRNLITQNKLRPHSLEEYRTLRTNLLTKSIQSGEKVFLVTSPTPNDGKSTTVANLAISIADANRKVLLIDGDLRNPQMHTFFDVPNESGMLSLLARADNEKYMMPDDVMAQVHQTNVNGLWLMTAGQGIQTPSETLDSDNTRRFMEILKTGMDFDVILLDTPPCLVVSDSVAFTTFFDTEVLFVVRAGKTRVQEVARSKDRFRHLPEQNLSVILNGVDLSFEDYYSRVPRKYQMARSPQLGV